MTVHGWDASDFDWSRGGMDVAAAARDGIAFFTHKATEGTRTQHVHYGEAMRRARDAGMPFYGPYIVPRTPGSYGHGSVASQVDYALTYIDQQMPWFRSTREVFLQVDTEHWGYDDVAPQYGAQMCAMLRQQTGKFVIHYAPRWAYGDTIPGNEPLWASSYGTNPTAPYRQAYPGDASDAWAPYSGRAPTFLQYGSKLTIGSQPGCDANAFRGTLDQLRTLITGGNTMAALQDDDGNFLNGLFMTEAVAMLREKLAGGPHQGWDVPLSKAINQIARDAAAARAAAEKPSASVAMTDADRQAIVAGVLAQMPKPPTAAEIAEELARRIANG